MTTQDDQSAGSHESVADVTPPDAAAEQSARSEKVDSSPSAPAAEQAAPPEAVETSAPAPASGQGHLVPEGEVMDLRARWEAIQQGFVDDPRSAVSDADTLVGEVLQRLSATFENQHRQLEGQWAEGEPSTEDLRGALRRYRDFFDRLLAL